MGKIQKKAKHIRRKRRVRAKVFGTKKRPRLSVFRSSKFIYAQLIDDEEGKTLVVASEKDIVDEKQGNAGVRKKRRSAEAKSSASPKDSASSAVSGKHSKTDKARVVGGILAKKAKRRRILTVVFDRSGYKYHGRVRALAEGARKGGLKF